MNSRMLFIVLFIFTSSVLVPLTFAQEPTKRSTSINFEDDVIEGINRKSLDSVSQISENNKNKKGHLYKKRATFIDRDQLLIRSIAGTQE